MGKGGDILRKYLLALLITLIPIIVVTYALYNFTGFNFKNMGARSIILIIFAAYLLLTFLSIGWFWYRYWLTKYYWNHSYYTDAKFNCSFKFWPYLKLKVGNFFLLIFSLGFLWPWTTIRNIEFLLNHLTLDGSLNFDEILQEVRATSATGESIADFLDIDAGVDLGI